MAPSADERIPSIDTGRHPRPHLGVPYRTTNEELTGKREKYDKYLEVIRKAGGEPVEISLSLPGRDLDELAGNLDAVVLPGSPADVEPDRYLATRHPETAPPDSKREQTDLTLLARAFADHKPVLAICFGVQILNVYLGGTLIQDIASETGSNIQHEWRNRDRGAPEPRHLAHIEPGTRLAKFSSHSDTEVNSSHHQAILEPAAGLRVAARAPDGIIEAVEWTGEGDWVVGVQWHPERMPGDALSMLLFEELVAAARLALVRG